MYILGLAVLTAWKYVGGSECVWPHKSHILSFKTCWITAIFTSSKMEGKTKAVRNWDRWVFGNHWSRVQCETVWWWLTWLTLTPVLYDRSMPLRTASDIQCNDGRLLSMNILLVDIVLHELTVRLVIFSTRCSNITKKFASDVLQLRWKAANNTW